MARPSTAATRNLTLTEELEKLEQSITLTLQGKHSRGWTLPLASADGSQKLTIISAGLTVS